MDATHCVVFRVKRPEFWFDELDTLLEMFGVDKGCYQSVTQYGEVKGTFDPVLLLRCDFPEADETLIKLSRRSVMIRHVLKLHAHGTSVNTVTDKVRSLQSPQFHDKAASETKTWKIDVLALNHTYSMKDQNDIRQKFLDSTHTSYLFQGDVNLSSTCDLHYQLIVKFTRKPNHPAPLSPQNVYFGRVLAEGMRETVTKYTLKSRAFLGPTSTEAELAFLMANQAKINPGDVIYDPFVGTGSILASCTALGAFCLGSDIDPRILRGKQGKTLKDNFIQYNLPVPDIFQMDFSPLGLSLLSHTHIDAIVTDPPYGIRAGAKKSDSSSYSPEDLLPDMIDLAARLLRLGGRLVFLLPVSIETYSPDILPLHSCFLLKSNSEDKLTTTYSRRLITMEKVSEYTCPEQYMSETARNREVLKAQNQVIGRDKQRIQPIDGVVILDKVERRRAKKLAVKQAKRRLNA